MSSLLLSCEGGERERRPPERHVRRSPAGTGQFAGRTLSYRTILLVLRSEFLGYTGASIRHQGFSEARCSCFGAGGVRGVSVPAGASSYQRISMYPFSS